jgi:hypothetical protein
MQDRQPTLFVTTGDMSLEQLDKRGGRRIAGRPYRAGVYTGPENLSFSKNEFGLWVVDPPEGEIAFDTDIGVMEMVEKVKRARERTGRHESYLKSMFVPNKTMSVHALRDRFYDLHREGFFPKVIVIDYADILAPEPHALKYEKRVQIDETWAALRRLSQEFHCLVLTATQSDAKARSQFLIDADNFSDARTKVDHVNGLIGLNQTSDEEEKFAYRLNWVVGREVPFAPTHWVGTAGSADFANPAMVSKWPTYDSSKN